MVYCPFKWCWVEAVKLKAKLKTQSVIETVNIKPQSAPVRKNKSTLHSDGYGTNRYAVGDINECIVCVEIVAF